MKKKPLRQVQHQKKLRDIGLKIREERKRLGLSLEALARMVGVSKMTLQRVEMGTTASSVVLLSEIAFHLKKPIESLFQEGDARVVHLQKDQQETLFDQMKKSRILAPRGLISDRITLTFSELEKKTVIETHTNNGFEWAFLIQGRATVEVKGNKYPFKAGDAIFYDAHFPHSISVNQKIKYVGLFLRDD